MFDLGSGKKKPEEFIFDLEEEMKDAGKAKELSSLVKERINTVKTKLRGGEEKETYDQLGVLLYGYTALEKVLVRVKKKNQ